MSAKQIIKSIVPKSAWKKACSIKDTMEASKARRIQRQRFMRWISLDTSTDKARVETRLAFDIHRLEKGLSHVNFRLGFGKGVLNEISKRMVLLEKADKNYKTNPLYQQGLSVLHEYQHRHNDVNYDLTSVKAMFPEQIWESALTYEPDVSNGAGSFIMNSSTKADNLSKGFVPLAQNRYSVREYSDKPVSQELLDKVYEVSMKTPSVCNRQATRIYQITDPEKN